MRKNAAKTLLSSSQNLFASIQIFEGNRSTAIETVKERLKGKMEMEELITQITERLPAIGGVRLVVGIDGLSRSGKTTLTPKLLAHYEKENIPVISFHLEDLIVERERRYGTGKAE